MVESTEMHRRQLVIALLVGAGLLLAIGLQRGATTTAPAPVSLAPLTRPPVVTVRSTEAFVASGPTEPRATVSGPPSGRRCEPSLTSAASDGAVHAIGLETGFELFGAGLPGPVRSANRLRPALVGHGRVVALDATNGLVHLFDLSASRRPQPEFSADAALAVHPRGFLFEERGKLVLRDADLRPLADVALTAPRAADVVVGPRGEVVVASTDETVRVYDGTLGVRVEVRLDADVTATPVVRPDGALVLASARGAIVTVAQDGAVMASVQVPGPVHRGLALDADGTVLVAIGGPRRRVLRLDAALRRVLGASAPEPTDDDGRTFGHVLAAIPGGGVLVGDRDRLVRLDATLKPVQRIDVLGLPTRIDRDGPPVVRVETCLYGFGAPGFLP